MTELWDALTARPGILVAAAIALLAVAVRPLWRVARTVVTIAHEGGHAVAALLAGRGLTGIRLHPDTSGVTVSTGARRGPGLVFTFLAGYPAPSLLGIGGAALVASGRSALALVLALVLLVATLVGTRNAYGVLVVLVTAGMIAAVTWWGEPRQQAWFAAGLTWFLLLGGLRAVAELRRARGSDADQLARLTRVPAGIWQGFFWLLAVAALAAGGLTMTGGAA